MAPRHVGAPHLRTGVRVMSAGDYDWGERSDFKDLYEEGDECPECPHDDPGEMVEREGRYGRFMGCSNYPDCTHTGEVA